MNCFAPLFAHVIAGLYKRRRHSPLRVRHVCLQSLQPEVFYPRKSEETSRICSSSIGWFFLPSMRPTLLQERPPGKTHESAPSGGGGTLQFTTLYVFRRTQQLTCRRRCHHRRPLLLPRSTMRRLCATFVPRASLARKR